MLSQRLDPTTVDKRSALRRAVIRSASAAILEEAPLSLLDPRGMIFDRSPSGTLTLRVRGTGSSSVLVQESGSNTSLDLMGARWEVFPIQEDDGLPGRRLLRNGAEGLQDLVALPGPLNCSIVTHRLGRRAVIRVCTADFKTTRYVKLLNTKAYRKAINVFSSLEGPVTHLVVQPRTADKQNAALVFDEVQGSSLHDRLWAGDAVYLKSLARSLSVFASVPPLAASRLRDIESERASALRALSDSETLHTEFSELQEALGELSPFELPGSALLHGDLHDKQVFLHGSAVRFIDAEGIAQGSPLIDIVNLAEHLRLRDRQGCVGAASLAIRLEAATGLDSRDPTIRVLRAVTRARLAGVYGRRPWWWDLAETLAVDAMSLLREFR